MFNSSMSGMGFRKSFFPLGAKSRGKGSNAVRGVEIIPVDEKKYGWVQLQPVFFKVKAYHAGVYAAVPKRFAYTGETYMFGFTQMMLQRLERLGIMFPVSLSGPFMFPALNNPAQMVPIWYSQGFAPQRGFDIEDGVIRVVEEFLSGGQMMLSVEDRQFLAAHYPRSREGYPEGHHEDVCERLGVQV